MVGTSLDPKTQTPSSPAAVALRLAAIPWLLFGGFVFFMLTPHWSDESGMWWVGIDPLSPAEAQARWIQSALFLVGCILVGCAHLVVAWKLPKQRRARQVAWLLGVAYFLLAVVCLGSWLLHRDEPAMLVFGTVFMVLGVPMLGAPRLEPLPE